MIVMADSVSAPSHKSYYLDLMRTYFRYVVVHGLGMTLFYFCTWMVLATSVGSLRSISLFVGCVLVSVFGLVFFNLRIKRSDLYLPKIHCAVAYTLVALLAVGAGVGIFFHIEVFESLPEKARLAAEVLGIVMFAMHFFFAIMRVTEARFLPDSLPGHASEMEPLR